MDTISMGSDHAGFEYKSALKRMLEKKGYNVVDHGAFSPESTDYPDHVHPVAEDVEEGRAKFGIILCGSGSGASITANKHQKIRASLCWKKELAELARQHNDANILALPARFVSLKLAKEMTNIFLETEFEGGRHKRRVDKIPV